MLFTKGKQLYHPKPKISSEEEREQHAKHTTEILLKMTHF